MNHVTLIGRVATEPRELGDKKQLCTFRLAVKRSVKNGEDNKADFFTVVTWLGLAGVCKQYLDIGREVSVQGRLRNRSYVKDNETHWVTEVVAEKVEFIGARKRTSETNTDSAEAAVTAVISG